MVDTSTSISEKVLEMLKGKAGDILAQKIAKQLKDTPDTNVSFTARQAAEKMGCTVRTIHNKIKAGELRKVPNTRYPVRVYAKEVLERT